MLHLTELRNEIDTIPVNEPVFIYIGVGAASSAGENPLSLDQYQQFPPFLQDIRNQVPKLHLFLLLLDPYHETPPRVAKDYALHDIHSQVHYTSVDGYLQAFVYRLSVYTDPDPNPRSNALNITATLRDLNKLAQEQRVSLLYHDFTGRPTALLAEYFEMEVQGHLDQIVYSLSAREDHGCVFDLTQPNAYFPFRLEQLPNQRPVVKMFNYYKFIVNNTYQTLSRELAQFPPAMHSLAEVQKKQIINNMYSQFKNTVLSILRQVYKIVQVPEEAPEKEYAPFIFNDFPYPYRKIFEDLYIEKNYSLLYEILNIYSANQLEIMAKLTDNVMSGEELLHFITLDRDPYKWHNALVDTLGLGVGDTPKPPVLG